ncbi:MotA/TolQ/ExbB proton channel family protein [Hoeflea sp. TYP-13]|uniref:MotA/TolQ/ExbB proton channel family protein n=1 Tax=Hoeflea sp. TYP-13 TaxID=3230023 RepID=UPI0034C6A5F0
MENLFSTTASLVKLGGPVVAILLGLSVIALAVILLKLAQFLYQRVGRRDRVHKALLLWAHGSTAEALSVLETDRSAVAEVMAVAMRLGSDRFVPKDVIEEEAGRVALARLYGLQRGFRALDAIVQIAPLLGLFGTVLGMIEAFQTLQSAGNAVDPSVLAGGIWVALLTTAAGLAVAMPVSLVLTWFESRIENERVAIETMTTKLMSQQHILSLGLEEEPRQRVVSLAERLSHAH